MPCDSGNYWNQTETFEALQWYIDLNFDGLRDDVLQMMAGKKIPVNTGSFTNDMTTFRTEDDVLTLLIHLGYLGYEEQNKYVFIPNRFPMGRYFKGTEKFRRSSAGCVGKTGNTGSRGNSAGTF